MDPLLLRAERTAEERGRWDIFFLCSLRWWFPFPGVLSAVVFLVADVGIIAHVL